MLREQTFDKLAQMRMHGLARAFQEQLDSEQHDRLSFEERVGLMIDREWAEREARRLTRRLQTARLREQACVEDIDYRHERGLDRRLMQRLATSRWVENHQNVLITGRTGVGKTYIACALAQKACRDGHTAIYRRVSRLFSELALAHADGSFHKLLTKLAKTHLLVLDDWGLAPLNAQERRDLLEILDDRSGRQATIVASQLPVDQWHKVIGEPTIADAVMDRLIHGSHRIALDGESMRKTRARLTNEEKEK